MFNWLIGIVVTSVFLIKMFFTDMAGSEDTIDVIKKSVCDAKEINKAFKEAEETAETTCK